jgi:hypothetical protein
MRLTVTQDRLRAALLAAGALLMLNIYFLRLRVLSDLVLVVVAVVASLGLASGALPRRAVRAVLLGLALFAAYMLGATALSESVDLHDWLSGVQNLALIALFAALVWLLLDAFGTRRLLLVLFVTGAASAAGAVALHLLTTDPLAVRLLPLGRPANAIPGAAVAAVAALAGLVLLREGGWSRLQALGILAGIAAAFASVLLSQSRGPLMGLLLGAGLVLLRRRPGRLVVWLPPLAFLAASSLVLIEGAFRALFCDNEQWFCRPSERLPLWERSAALILENPLAGMGARFRLGEGSLNNAQNAALGLALHYGIPVALAAAVLAALFLRHLARSADGPATRWAVAMTAFSAVYYAFEPNPLAYYNAHYLFLWAPVVFALREGGPPRGAAA